MNIHQPNVAIRTLSACYFGCLSIFATLFIQMLLVVIGMSDLIPLGLSLLLAIPIAALFGALFALPIVKKERSNAKVFWWGVLLITLALPIYDFGLLFLLQEHHSSLYRGDFLLNEVAQIYFFILVYSFVLIYPWLAILAGLSALLFRHQVAPGIVKYCHQLSDNYQRNVESSDKQNRTSSDQATGHPSESKPTT